MSAEQIVRDFLSDYETYGLSLLEALACGAAVGVRDDSDWARRLRRLGLPHRPGSRFTEEHRQRAHHFAQAHSWPRAVKSWERWLSKLTRPRPQLQGNC